MGPRNQKWTYYRPPGIHVKISHVVVEGPDWTCASIHGTGKLSVIFRNLKEIVREFVNASQDDCDSLLVPLEFAYNSSVNASTGSSPFHLLYGEELFVL